MITPSKMKLLFMVIFSFFCFTGLSQVKYNQQIQVDPEVQLLLDQGEDCLQDRTAACKSYFLDAIAWGQKNKVSYMDYLYFQLGHFFDVRTQYDSSQHYIKIAY